MAMCALAWCVLCALCIALVQSDEINEGFEKQVEGLGNMFQQAQEVQEQHAGAGSCNFEYCEASDDNEGKVAANLEDLWPCADGPEEEWYKTTHGKVVAGCCHKVSQCFATCEKEKAVCDEQYDKCVRGYCEKQEGLEGVSCMTEGMKRYPKEANCKVWKAGQATSCGCSGVLDDVPPPEEKKAKKKGKKDKKKKTKKPADESAHDEL